MFGDIVSIVDLVVSLVQTKRKKRGGWYAAYQMYLELGRVIHASERALGGVLSRPIDDVVIGPHSRFRTQQAKWAYMVNEDLHEVTLAYVAYMRYFEQLVFSMSFYDKKLTDLLISCMQEKVSWFNVFQEYYSTGIVSKDAAKMKRSLVAVVPLNKVDSYKGVFEHNKSKIIKKETINLGDDQARQKIVRSGQKNLVRLKQSHADLEELIRQKCSIDDLL